VDGNRAEEKVEDAKRTIAGLMLAGLHLELTGNLVKTTTNMTE
jgi:hypothetical protein